MQHVLKKMSNNSKATLTWYFFPCNRELINIFVQFYIKKNYILFFYFILNFNIEYIFAVEEKNRYPCIGYIPFHI